MKIFENNEMINKFDDLNQAILLFDVQNKYIPELSEQDCIVIADLLKELKELKEKTISTKADICREFAEKLNEMTNECGVDIEDMTEFVLSEMESEG